MTSNINWYPVKFGEEQTIDTWRPSSFLAQIRDRFGYEPNYIFNQADIDWLREVETIMGTDGGGHSEAAQLIAAIEQHGSIMLEVEG